jgi:hypothetical protein
MIEQTADYAKSVVCCRQCDTTWRTQGSHARENCPKCGKRKDVRYRPGRRGDIEKIKAWRAKRPKQSTDWMRRQRRRALVLVGQGTIACVRCGCDRPELLEINHKSGGGRKDLVGKWFYRAIVKLERDTDDLELLCRPCNAIHYLESKYGPLPLRVVWEGAAQ